MPFRGIRVGASLECSVDNSAREAKARKQIGIFIAHHKSAKGPKKLGLGI